MYSIIVVDFYSIERTIKYLASCYENILDSNCFHAFVVDNSPDGIAVQYFKENGYSIIKEETEEILCEVYRVKIHTREFFLVCAYKNLGYGGGNNLGVQISNYFFDDSYYVFCNNDLQFTKPFKLWQLAHIIEDNDKIAAVGPRIVSTDGNPQSPYKYTSMWQQTVYDSYHKLSDKIFNKFTPALNYEGKSGECYWVSGCFFLVKRNKFLECNGFDQNVFLYAEEEILSERLKKIGCSFYFYDDITIIHAHNSTVKNYYSELRRMSLSFHSSWYYFEHYLDVSKKQIFLAKVLFQIFKPLYILKSFLKKILINQIDSNRER